MTEYSKTHTALSLIMQVSKNMNNGLMVCLLALAFTVTPLIYATAAEADNPNAPPANSTKDTEDKDKTSALSVQAIVATNPRTAPDLARSADLLAELGEPELAKTFLKKILDANPNQQQLLELADQSDTTMFMKMASNPALAPEAKQLADKVIAAVEKDRNDPGRIDKLIKQLGDESPDKRFRATEDLLSTGSAAVEPLIRVLANPALSAQHAAVRATLARMGSDAVRPLVALLDSGNQPLVEQAIRTLGEAGSKKRHSLPAGAPARRPKAPPRSDRPRPPRLCKSSARFPIRHKLPEFWPNRRETITTAN